MNDDICVPTAIAMKTVGNDFYTFKIFRKWF